MKVFELRIRIYILIDIPLEKIYAAESNFIDTALAKDARWLKYHQDNHYKYYCISGFYPVEKEGTYKKDHLYTITVRTVNLELAKYLSKVLTEHSTKEIKGLVVENRIIPKKMIEEIYTLTPVIQKSDQGYWRNVSTLDDFEKQLFGNAVKKYNQFTGKKLDEEFVWYTGIQFLNKMPVKMNYKGIHLLGDKLNLKIADNKNAQELTYFLLGTGIGENNTRGGGFCNFRWI